MIENAEHLDAAMEQLKRLYRAMASLRSKVADVDARRFALLVEGPIAQIDQIQAEIDAYTGRNIAEPFMVDDDSGECNVESEEWRVSTER